MIIGIKRKRRCLGVALQDLPVNLAFLSPMHLETYPAAGAQLHGIENRQTNIGYRI